MSISAHEIIRPFATSVDVTEDTINVELVEKYKVSIKRSAAKEIEAVPQKKSDGGFSEVSANRPLNHPRQGQRNCPVTINIVYIKVPIE
jgi:hypothetical protein